MNNILPHSLLKGFCGIRVLVVGDVMLDRFVYGRTERMSPEAPVPILAASREDVMAGGAGNVARNIASLGGSAHIVAVIGDDAAGIRLQEILSKEQRISADLIVLQGRRTTEKTRFISDRQQLLRVDREETTPVTDDAVPAALAARLEWADIVVISDYAKGLLTDDFLQQAIARIRAAGKKVIVDPKSADIKRYDGASVLTPNRPEAALASGIAGDGDEDSARAAAIILDAAPAVEAVLVTRGARGMTLAARGEAPIHISTAARAVSMFPAPATPWSPLWR